jgi:hypothetical protein
MLLEEKKSFCTIRESNPRQTLGKRLCYHYTNGATGQVNNFGEKGVAPFGNRTRGKRLEGVYVTTTPMVLKTLVFAHLRGNCFDI